MAYETSENRIILRNRPRILGVFTKALAVSLFRSRTLDAPDRLQKAEILLSGQILSKENINRYRSVCGFDREPATGSNEVLVPSPYLQTLFVGLLGRYITSEFFPITPLGLIHTRQSMEQLRPVFPEEVLDLSCCLEQMMQTDKGIKTCFLLEAKCKGKPVWRGVSEFLTRSGEKGPEKKKKVLKEEVPMEPGTEIPVPRDIGRRYASVSGDYNPHHLYGITARLFGFRSPIAHGMWSLARVTAELAHVFPLGPVFKIEASFKRPVFLPARTVLGYEWEKSGCPAEIAFPNAPLEDKAEKNPAPTLHFELRDADSGIPHIKGSLILPPGERPE